MAALGIEPDFQPLTTPALLVITTSYVLIGTGVAAFIGRRSADPVRTFTIVALLALAA